MIKNKTRKIIIILLAALSLISVVYLTSLVINKPNIVITKTTPANNDTNVQTTMSTVNISFAENIPEKDTEKITYDIQPQISSESLVSSNQMIIGFKEALQKGATYTVDIKYNNEQIYEIKFETELFTQQQIQKEGSLQSQADQVFNNSYKDFIQKNPWYLKIPIENNNYRVVYDFDKNMFRIRILSTTATSDEIESFTQNALSDLKNIGVPEPIKYFVLDLNGNQL